MLKAGGDTPPVFTRASRHHLEVESECTIHRLPMGIGATADYMRMSIAGWQVASFSSSFFKFNLILGGDQLNNFHSSLRHGLFLSCFRIAVLVLKGYVSLINIYIYQKYFLVDASA